MRRGAFLLAAIALAATTTPAGAATKPAPANVVYEVVRLRPGASTTAIVEATASGGDPGMEMMLVPDEPGRYGSGSGGVWWSGTWSGEVTLGPGQRFLVGGVRGHLSVRVSHGSGWGVRARPLGFRVVRGLTYTATDRFETASVASGPYGGVVLAHAPCGAGVWSLHTPQQPGSTELCTAEEIAFTFQDTTSDSGWVLDGEIVAPSSGGFRFIEMDFPKRQEP